MIFKNLLDTDRTIFIAGEHEELRREILDPLLASEIQHFYFINPKENLKRYLEEIAEPQLISYVRHIKEIEIGGNNIIACGFKPVARSVIAALKKHQPGGFVFFEHRLGPFKANWEAIASLTIKEQSLAQYVAKHQQQKLYKSSRVVDTEGTFFTNRGEMLDSYRDFINRKNQRCCKIIGMKGIGKRAFIRRLKFVMALGENCFEVRFTDKSDDISYLLGQLLTKFGIPYAPEHLEHFSSRKVLPVVDSLFQQFDSISEAKIVFYNIDAIYDSVRRRFYDRNIETFFHQLLQRETYPRQYNRIYFIANENFNCRAAEDRNVIYTIHLRPMHPEHIQFIVEHEFNTKFKKELAQAFMKYDFDTVSKLLGGHPQIAKLFVEACEHYPMDSIIKDPQFRKKFDAEKAAYLMEHITLDSGEEKMLHYLSLFKAHFTIDAIKAMEPRPHTVIENLRDKFLLEKEDFADAHSEYYVPSIIQDYTRIRMGAETTQSFHNQIGMYYWSRAEDLKTPPPEVLEAYRLALYHFSQAGNSQQEQHLVMYFKGIFLKKAREAYAAEDYETAWHYYHELSQQTQLEDKDLNFYLICNARLDKADTQELYEGAIVTHKTNHFIKTSYASYLFERRQYTRAQEICEQVREQFPDNDVANTLYPKILAKTGQKEQAVALFEQKIRNYKQKGLNEKSRKNRIITYMSYYQMLEYHEAFKRTIAEVIGLLKADRQYIDELNGLFTRPFSRNAAKIDAVYQQAIAHPRAARRTYTTYANFLRRQGRIQEADKIFQQAQHLKGLPKTSDSTGKLAEEKSFFNEFHYKEELLIESISPEKIQSIQHTEVIKNGQQYRIVIERKIADCKAVMQKSQELLDHVLALDANDYLALYASAGLLRNFEDVATLKRIVEICYDDTQKQAFLGGLTMQKTVFISYSHNDSDFVQQLKAALEARQIGVTIDTEACRFGDSLEEFVEKSVRETELTISVVSRNSLQSVWVLAETLSSLMYEHVEGRRKFIPIYIDKSFLEDECYLEIVEHIDAGLDKLKDLMMRALDLNLGTAMYDDKRQRLTTLRNNLDTILRRLRTYLVGDFSDAQKLQDNLPKLVELIKANINDPATQPEKDVKTAATTDNVEENARERLRTEYADLSKAYQTESERITRLRRDLVIETDTLIKFKLEQQLQELEAKRQTIAQRLQELEAQLK